MVGANTYGSEAGVEKLVGDLVAGRDFGAGTVPTTTQVEGVLDDIAADLNRELDVEGYTVPVNATDYPTARAFLVAVNNYGAAAVILGMFPVGAYNPNAEEQGNSRAEMYQKRLNSAIKMIREHRLKAGMTTQRFALVFSGGQEDEDGNEKLPLFQRGQTDYPSSRSLIKE